MFGRALGPSGMRSERVVTRPPGGSYSWGAGRDLEFALQERGALGCADGSTRNACGRFEVLHDEREWVMWESRGGGQRPYVLPNVAIYRERRGGEHDGVEGKGLISEGWSERDGE